MGKYKKYIIPTIIFAAAFYIALSFYGNIDRLGEIFENFNWAVLPLLLIISLLNFFFRFIKWHFYLKGISSDVSGFESYLIFNSAMSLSFTPGKVGDFIKTYFLKETKNLEVSKTAAIVFAERVTDMVSLLLITIFGAYSYGYGLNVILVLSTLFFVLILLLSFRGIGDFLADKLAGIKLLGKIIEPFRIAYITSGELLHPVKLILMTALTVIAWGIECLGFYIILFNFNVQVSYYNVLFIYSFSILVGSVSMSPAGLGFTEGSLTYLLMNNNVKKDIAVASVILIRVVTLWFSVLVGLISLFFYKKHETKITNS